jgi:uncharacterized protein YjiK
MLRNIAPIAAALLLNACDNPLDIEHGPPADSASFQQWKLPKKLREISGLALTADQRLLAVTDEEAAVYELDYRNGVLVKVFTLGSPTLRGDFEGIAVLGEFVWLMTSDGRLLVTREGQDGERMSFAEYDSGAGKYCELEGLAADVQAASLLLACKEPVASRDPLKIFEVAIVDGRPARMNATEFPEASVMARLNRKHTRPSGIAIDPASGHRVMVAANHAALISLTPDGTLIDAIILPGEGRHRQAEGIAITADGRLLIADEGGNGRARLAVYAWTRDGMEPEK